MMCNLASVSEGDAVEVIEILNAGDMRRRLIDFGIVKGTVIQCYYKGPAGDPTAYHVRGTTVALRRDDAQNIIVRKISVP